ncbi:TetR/AcrR family transcriptional regulator [Glycomyces sp. A-F 0318]|uniref:TetR/AcrR family transcriptional regulator n=1 Tax=Glycomyces amatae TaxID=2881355 RepID=UPI001E2E0D6C|nr:TetR/AcrR family transcriptional regulator [Glycomyces amatae]MCD0443802.1 TetR/AcrR family transcriptional regulator [Glycomyces amatae]
MAAPTNIERGRVARERLLAAARDLIGEIGWNAVSTRILAERAGVRPGLVHYHFESLQALLRQAVLEAMGDMLGGTAAFLAAAEDPAEGIDAVLSGLDGHTGDDPTSLLFIEAYLAATRDVLLHERMQALMLDFRGVLAAALDRAGHPAPDDAAAFILAVIDGFLLHKGLDPNLSAVRIAPLLRRVVEA